MIEKSCFSLPWNERQCAAAIQQEAFAAYGLFFGIKLFAYISFYHIEDEMEIVNLAVTDRMRRLGHGRFLLNTALREGQKMGIHRVSLEVRRQNIIAISLYEGCGFILEGVRRRYYRDTGEDALIYQKYL